MPRLSPIPPWRGPIDLKNRLVDDVVVVVVFFSSRIPWTVHQHTLKGFVLFDEHLLRLFIALTGIAFATKSLSTTITLSRLALSKPRRRTSWAIFLPFSSSFPSSSLDGHGSKSVGLGGSGFLSDPIVFGSQGTRTSVHIAWRFHGLVHKMTVVILDTSFG